MRSCLLFVAALTLIIFPCAGFAQQGDFEQVAKKYENISSGYRQFKFGMSEQEVSVIIKHLYPRLVIKNLEKPNVGPDLILPHIIKYTDLDASPYVASVQQKSVLILLEGQDAGAPAIFWFLDDKLVCLSMVEIRAQLGTHKDFYEGIKEKYSGRQYAFDGKRQGFPAHAMFGRNDNNVVWAETIYDSSSEMVSLSYCEPAFYDAAQKAAEQLANQKADAKKSLID